MKFESFFRSAYGQGAHGPLTPFDYQRRLSEECMWPDVVNVPTGLGKTAGVTFAWPYNRCWRSGGRDASSDSSTPTRLIWCLTIRLLVAQTKEDAEASASNTGLLGTPGQGQVPVQVLMGRSHR